MSVSNLWGQLKLAAGAGILNGLDNRMAFARNIYFVGDNAPTFVQQKNTIADALSSLLPGDALVLGPQGFQEDDLVLPATAGQNIIVGMGGRGACYIEAQAVGANGLNILADDVTIVNVGFASEATADYSVKLGDANTSPARLRMYQCKLEGNEGANPGGQLVLCGSGDVIIEDCEFTWGVNGIIGLANLSGFPTQTLLRRCWFHDLTTVHIGVEAASHFVELWVEECRFDLDESGTPPTDFILLSDNANIGSISGCRFANPTNDTAVITIGTGMLYMANATEAGWSTARPA